MDRIGATRDLLAESETITVPALFLHGRGDPRPAATELVKALPNSSLVLIPDAGHLPWLENYSAVRDAIRQISWWVWVSSQVGGSGVFSGLVEIPAGWSRGAEGGPGGRTETGLFRPWRTTTMLSRRS
jgi:hypothetical protein